MRNSKTSTVFARKLIQQFADVTREDIEREAKTSRELCDGSNPFVIQVLKHGWMSKTLKPPFYYIDMELCPETLEQRIETMKEHPFIKNIAVGDSFRIDWDQLGAVFDIVLDIAKGIEYIHSKGKVHRDLKPRNSNIHLII